MKYWFLAASLCVVTAAPGAAQTPPRPLPQGQTVRPGSIQIDTSAIRRDSAARSPGAERVREGIVIDASTMVAPVAEAGSVAQRTPGAVSRLRITLHTGGDDLRRGSSVKAFIITRNGRRVESKPLNCSTERGCASLDNNTRHTFEWDLHANEVVRPAEIHRFGLDFASGQIPFLQTGDNWNLDRVEVEYLIAVGDAAKPAGIHPLLNLAGRPLKRFHTAEAWESEPLRP